MICLLKWSDCCAYLQPRYNASDDEFLDQIQGQMTKSLMERVRQSVEDDVIQMFSNDRCAVDVGRGGSLVDSSPSSEGLWVRIPL